MANYDFDVLAEELHFYGIITSFQNMAEKFLNLIKMERYDEDYYNFCELVCQILKSYDFDFDKYEDISEEICSYCLWRSGIFWNMGGIMPNNFDHLAHMIKNSAGLMIKEPGVY